jgi:hypothetical protein
MSDFSGNYNGNGYTISNLTITTVDNEQEVAGLFGVVSGAIVNVRLIGVNIAGEEYVGGIAGKIQNQGKTKIDHCFVSDVTITGKQCIGGVAGSNHFATVSNCMVINGTIGVSKSSSNGGIVGYNSGKVENCYITVNLSGENIGGIVGSNMDKGIVQHCYATGNFSSRYFAGGIVGLNGTKGSESTIQNCVALSKEGSLDGTGMGTTIGRIVGGNNDGVLINNYARSNMILLNESESVPITDISTTSIHGANVEEADYNGANSNVWWNSTATFDPEAWSFDTNRLPWLNGFNGITQNPKVRP